MLSAAIPAETASYGEVAKTINGIMKTSQNEEYISSGVERLVKQAGADTMLQNAQRDGAEFAWIPHGDTCAFCIMLASNGWVRASKKTVKGGHAEHIHAHCDCEFAIRFGDDTKYAGYDPSKYKEIYDNAEGGTWEEKLNSMRRDNYAENADKIREQKRAAYADQKAALKEANEDGIINKQKIIQSGAISGALDPQSSEASDHAEQYYESVRHMKTDVKRISENTGFTEEEIQAVKSFIFEEEHDLDGEVKRFYPCYEMAQSWQRLIDGKNIQNHDITLIRHELLERKLMLQGKTQEEAHIEASKKYNYSEESNQFYDKAKKHKI